MRRGIVRIGCVLLIALVSCTSDGVPLAIQSESPSPEPSSPSPRIDARVRAAAEVIALRSFPDCKELLSYFRREAIEHMGPYGLPWSSGGVAVATAAEFARAPMAADAGSGATTGAGGLAGARADSASMSGSGNFSTTNVQEAGVDEPDTVKTDGRRIFTVTGDRVTTVSVVDGRPRFAGSLRFENAWGSQLLLAGDRLLVIEGGGYGIAVPAVAGAEGDAAVGSGVSRAPEPGWRGRTGIHVVDVRDPGKMRVVETLWVEGSYVSARMVDGIARVVMRTSGAGVAFAYPRTGTRSEEREVVRINRRKVARTALDDWLPRYTIERGRTEPLTSGRPLVPCDQVRRPPEFSGLEMVSVLTVDPADPRPREAATVVGTGETVYASTTGLYVTTNRWDEVEALRSGRRPSAPRFTTAIHRFDITDPRRARYVSSGEVPGHLLNQWSLSEHEGFLRVATTLEPWNGDSVSQIAVLEPRGPLLDRIGRVGGLGKTERIYAVRFIGDLGYVVTFRQTDPLYVIDLSNPRRPRVRGELKIPGFSSYLHPVDDGHLLGVGQDATDEGQTLGVQASLFDVADPDDPRQVDRLSFGPSHTQVQDDHRAFLWWGPERLAVFPIWSYDGADGQVTGAVALRVGDGTIRRLGRIEHPRPDAGPGGSQGKELYPYPSSPQVERALVIGGTLYTVSQAGLLASDLETLDRRAWVEWPQPERR